MRRAACASVSLNPVRSVEVCDSYGAAAGLFVIIPVLTRDDGATRMQHGAGVGSADSTLSYDSGPELPFGSLSLSQPSITGEKIRQGPAEVPGMRRTDTFILRCRGPRASPGSGTEDGSACLTRPARLRQRVRLHRYRLALGDQFAVRALDQLGETHWIRFAGRFQDNITSRYGRTAAEPDCDRRRAYLQLAPV